LPVLQPAGQRLQPVGQRPLLVHQGLELPQLVPLTVCRVGGGKDQIGPVKRELDSAHARRGRPLLRLGLRGGAAVPLVGPGAVPQPARAGAQDPGRQQDGPDDFQLAHEHGSQDSFG
jgi:hypothetical protein